MGTSSLPHAAGKIYLILPVRPLLIYLTEVISLARECDVPDILPSAFYALSIQKWRNSADGGRSHVVLHPSDLRRLIVGRESLQDILVDIIADPLHDSSDPDLDLRAVYLIAAR